ncbi:hypothetical protein [Spiroplasma endosymbiont of Stenodema calcarata]|uniref:hypothetical protein n=1 Tax=Spiroplasma endosymbiont of Stenodema calcarata TaxID=3139328 RepID=UPI003CCB6059
MKFKVKFKDYVQDENHFVSFNVTDDLPKLNLITKYLSEVILPIFRTYAEEYANVNLGEENIFKKLYQEFNIMYGKDYQEVEDIFKNSFKTYVKAKSESEKYKISFNNQNPFLKQTRSAFLMWERK